MSDRRQLADQAKIFKALGHPSRLLMADHLRNGPMCVCDLQELVGADISTVSRHLGVLKEAGVVHDEKRGVQVYYALSICCLGTFLDCCSQVLQQQVKDRIARVV